MFFVKLLQSAHLLYHTQFNLSRTFSISFLIHFEYLPSDNFYRISLFSYQCSLFSLLQQLVHFIKSLFVCQALFYFLNFVLSSLSCDSLFILSKCFSFVKNFFKLFDVDDKAEKEGFEPSRQFPDLYP